jgi:Fe-S-cluster containining protein
MTDQRFECTACGKCCYGLLPLSIEDALKHAGRFPLAISIRQLKTGIQGQAAAEALTLSLDSGRNTRIALLAAPVSFVPADMRCPELADDNGCSIHHDKPLRCRTMPFSALRDESHQAELLQPRKDWQCSTAGDAAVVYRDNKIVERQDFDRERTCLIDDAVVINRYLDLFLQHNPGQHARVLQSSKSSATSNVMVSFVSFLRYNKKYDLLDFARRQYPVLDIYVKKTAREKRYGLHHRYYSEAMAELQRYL